VSILHPWEDEVREGGILSTNLHKSSQIRLVEIGVDLWIKGVKRGCLDIYCQTVPLNLSLTVYFWMEGGNSAFRFFMVEVELP
jgi:hypothetical protein